MLEYLWAIEHRETHVIGGKQLCVVYLIIVVILKLIPLLNNDSAFLNVACKTVIYSILIL